MRIGALASHAGTTLEGIIEATETGAIDGEVVVVVCNNKDAGVFDVARRHGVPARHVSTRSAGSWEDEQREIRDLMTEHCVDVIVLAGYLKRVGGALLDSYGGRMLNVHPALLPRFGGQGMYGLNVHRAVLEAGDTVTGATIHWVNAEYDAGALVAQIEVPVLPGDTPEMLSARVHPREIELFVGVLADMARG